MAFADDFSVAANGDIRWTAGASTNRYTVLEMHRALQDLADDAVASGDDLLDISDDTPSDRSTDNIITLINGYNIDDTAAEKLYDGSVTQADGDTIYSGMVVVGSVEAGTEVIIIQNHALLTDHWTATPNADAANNIILRTLIKTRDDGVDIDGQRLIVQAREFGDTYAEFVVTMGLGNNTAALFTSSDLNNQTAQATVNAWVIGNTEGYQLLDVAGDGSADEPYYSQWDLGVQGINDLYEFAKDIQRRGTAETIHGQSGALFRGITHQIAYDGEAGGNPATNDAYHWGLKVDYTGQTGTFQSGEVVTFSTSNAKGRILDDDDNGASGSLVIAIESGTPVNGQTITGASSGATATANSVPVGQATGGGTLLILAVDDNGTDGTMWGQLVRGTAPADDAIMYLDADHSQTATVNGAPVSRTVPVPFIGQTTGSAIIGGYGIGVDPTDLTANDQLFDLTNTLVTPPNNVTFTVSGLVSGEDRVLVGPESGGALETDQDTINGALTGAAVTSVVVNTAIPSDTPSSGTLRIQADDGRFLRVPYDSYTGSTYTIPSFDFSGSNNCADGNDIFISYIDVLASAATASFTSVYLADRALFIRVRDGGGTPIKTFETTGTLGSAGGSATTIRTSDA